MFHRMYSHTLDHLFDGLVVRVLLQLQVLESLPLMKVLAANNDSHNTFEANNRPGLLLPMHVFYMFKGC